jgi:hypothetical protein
MGELTDPTNTDLIADVKGFRKFMSAAKVPLANSEIWANRLVGQLAAALEQAGKELAEARELIETDAEARQKIHRHYLSKLAEQAATIEAVKALRNEWFAALDSRTHEVFLEDVLDALDGALSTPATEAADVDAQTIRQFRDDGVWRDGTGNMWVRFDPDAATRIWADVLREVATDAVKLDPEPEDDHYVSRFRDNPRAHNGFNDAAKLPEKGEN